MRGKNSNNLFYLDESDSSSKSMAKGSQSGKHFMIITGAGIAKGRKEAAIIEGFEDSTFGKKSKDWEIWKDKNTNVKIYKNPGKGQVGDPIENATVKYFYPMYIDAEDGPIVDLGNKARLKSTLIGAGAGGALGAFTAYNG